MARILPDDIASITSPGTSPAELTTLAHLERGLSDEFTVYPSTHWTHTDERIAAYGEIDFIVVNRYGRVLAIEQKNGMLESGAHDLIKTYASGRCGVLSQVARNIGALQTAFGRRYPGHRLDIDHLLYLPDHEANGRLPASVDPTRVVDARSTDSLAERVQTLFDQRAMPTADRDVKGALPPDRNVSMSLRHRTS